MAATNESLTTFNTGETVKFLTNQGIGCAFVSSVLQYNGKRCYWLRFGDGSAEFVNNDAKFLVKSSVRDDVYLLYLFTKTPECDSSCIPGSGCCFRKPAGPREFNPSISKTFLASCMTSYQASKKSAPVALSLKDAPSDEMYLSD
jgi:hypothetical protein